MAATGWRSAHDRQGSWPGGMIAAVLAGGAGRRFGGGEKGLALFRGKPMITRALKAVNGTVQSTVIIANRPELYSTFGLSVYPDVIRGMGPLSGLHAAFHHTGASGILLLACDMPLVSAEMVKFLAGRAEDAPGDAVIPIANGKEQGLFAVYRRRALDKHLARIAAASIQFDEFRRAIEKTLIGEDELRKVEPGLASFINVNSKADLALLEKGESAEPPGKERLK